MEAQLARDPQYGLIDPGIRTPSLFLFISAFSLFEVYSDNPLAEHTKEARSAGVQGNPQVVSANDYYTCFSYPHAARPWSWHVK